MTPHRDNGGNGLTRVAVRWQPDSRLVKLVREDHDLAFDEIVRRYRPRLVSYAAAIVPEHQAEDVVQEALTRAHAALARSDGDMNLRPWLHTIVRNGALNSLRDEPVHVHLDENYDGVPQPPDVAARREELAALTASMRALPEEQRQALVKRELEGRSHDEIGASLGLSPGAVRGLIYRARTTLRDGAGMLIPLPVLRALLSYASPGPDAAGAAGAAAAGLAGGGGRDDDDHHGQWWRRQLGRRRVAEVARDLQVAGGFQQGQPTHAAIDSPVSEGQAGKEHR
jgi:RNA polymerase sigma factor (sigma-70 family)